MIAKRIHHRAVIPGALCVAAALSWALVQTRQEDPAQGSQPANPRVSPRDRPHRDSSTLPSRADRHNACAPGRRR